MSRREWIARSRSLLAAVVLLAVPLATDTMSDQDQTVPGASASGEPVPLPPELVRYGGAGARPFLTSTGRLFSLKNNHGKDDRRNLELSTEAAVKFLKRLHDIFGDWFLAIAAYNAGEVHIRKAMREQRVDDYWKLHYATETMRYVPRIIASKEIFSQPDKYLGVAKADLYPPLDTEVVTVNVKEDRRHLAAVAEEFGTYFLELKLLNPEIRKDYLPRGTHQIKIPRRPDNGCPMPCEKADEPR